MTRRKAVTMAELRALAIKVNGFATNIEVFRTGDGWVAYAEMAVRIDDASSRTVAMRALAAALKELAR